MRTIEGTSEATWEYLRRTEHTAKSEARTGAVEHVSSQHICFDVAGYSRRKERDTTRRIVSYMNSVTAIPGIGIRTGLRQGSDGFHSSVFIVGSTNQPLAAVASLDAAGGLEQRLSPEEAGEVGGLPTHILAVPADSQNVVERPVVRDEPVDLAVTDLAIRKPRK
ncbi:hypothetical protein [Streptomyces sp. NPDC088789]|uniref:hypothetical protein n=1 Tax=Streptomyces sp. NPDC088789 TaxID=3365899 RepID=UPI0037F494AD